MADGSLNVFDESYKCQALTDAHINECLGKLDGNENSQRFAHYPAPQLAAHGPGQSEIRGRLYAAGIIPKLCKAQVKESIRELQDWIGADGNGRRLLHVHPRCRHLRSELVSYAYDPGAPDQPLKAFDHGTDAARYLAWTLRHER